MTDSPSSQTCDVIGQRFTGRCPACGCKSLCDAMGLWHKATRGDGRPALHLWASEYVAEIARAKDSAL